jgi:hypothetical protein
MQELEDVVGWHVGPQDLRTPCRSIIGEKTMRSGEIAAGRQFLVFAQGPHAQVKGRWSE